MVLVPTRRGEASLRLNCLAEVTRGLHPVNLAWETAVMTLATDPSAQFESDRTMGLIIYGLLFAGLFFVGVPALVGVVLAYTQRPSTAGPIQGHFRFQIQIFWIGFLLALIAGISGLWAVLDVAGQVWNSGQMSAGDAGVDVDLTQLDLSGRVLGLVGVSIIALIFMSLWGLCAPAVGFIKLATLQKPRGASAA
ncbi:MAG: hypothetical protein EBS42_10955 [Caulobacteraceae bacterium]|nr:hypothetical protein [Caulobacteraceae bacterium]